MIKYRKMKIAVIEKKVYKLYHRFHLVEPSILPFLTSLFLGLILFNFVFVFLNQKIPTDINGYIWVLYLSIIGLLIVVAGWFYIIREEATIWGKHNRVVRRGLWF